MADNNPSQLPAYIALRYEENGVFDKFSSEAERAAAETKKRFNQAFTETERVVTGAVGRISSEFGKLDLGVGQFRQQQAEIKLYKDALQQVSIEAQRLAKETGDNSEATRTYLRALREQTLEAGRALDVADRQVTTYTRLQNAIDASAGANRRLAESQRQVYAEQARAAREDLAARERQNLYAVGFGYDRPSKSARDSASVFEGAGYKPAVDLRDSVQKIRDGDAAMDKAALSGVTLEQVLGRVAGKSRLVTAAVEEQARADATAAAENLKLAQAIERLHAEVDPLVALQQRYTAQVQLLEDAERREIITAEQRATIQGKLKTSLDEGTTSTRNVINSMGALRQATLQSGQQLQDIVISLYSGQQASIVFAQQLPQLAFGLSGLEGSANKTHDRIGRFATFLSGPWGIAVGLAVGVAGTLVTELLGIGDEADKAAGKTYDFTRSLDVLTLKGNEATEAMRQLAAETRSAVREQGDFLDQRGANAQNAVRSLERGLASDRETLRARQGKVGSFGLDIAGAIFNAKEISRLQDEIKAKTASLEDARDAATSADIARSQRQVASLDKEKRATIDYGVQVGKLEQLRQRSIALEQKAKNDPLSFATNTSDYITASEYERRLKSLQDIRDAAVKAAREADKAATSYERSSLIRPVDGGRITGRVGEARPGHTHAGVDIAVPVGTQVKAPAGGVVVQAGVLPGYGNVIFIDHGSGTISRLAHLSKIGVAKGDTVDQGEVVGLSGGAPGAAGSGRSTGAHLHYEVRRGGKAVDPFGSYPTDAIGAAQRSQKLQEQAARAAEVAARKQQELAEFGDRAGESIQRINERFNEQPRLVDQANAATRQLDATIKDLADRKPPGFEQMIADAQVAKDVVQDALVRPFRELVQDSQRRVGIQAQLAAGHEDEATALQEIYRLTDLLGPLTQDQIDGVRDLVRFERERSRELERQRDLFDAQIEVIDTGRRSLTGLLSGRGNNPFKEIAQSLQDLQGKRLFDQLFGDVFDDLENELRGQSPLGKESQHFADEMSVATDTLGDFTAALRSAAAGAANDIGGSAAFQNAFGSSDVQAAVSALIADQKVWPNGMPAQGGTGEIVVTANIAKPSIMDLANRVAGGVVEPFQSGLNGLFGTKFGQTLGGVTQGAIAGVMTGGTTGGILGGLKGLVDKGNLFGGAGGGLSSALGKAGSGAATGTMTSGILQGLGIKTSQTGAQIGGAIGSFIPIPGGEIIGSIAGGLLGGLLKKTKKGYANNIMIGADGDATYSTTGNSASRIKAGSEAADGLVSALDNIANQLGGGLLNSLNLGSLGMRKDKYTFDPTPGNSAGRQEFDSQEEAVRAAMVYAIDKGVITGIRQSTQRLLQEGDDLDKALQDALTWENAFKELKRYKDPLGAAVDELNGEFDKLIKLADQAGASAEERAQLEELYGLKRNEIVKEQAEKLTGSLKSLLDDLTTGDNGLSLRDRRAAALSAYDPLKARVAAGDSSAYDEYADAAQKLLDIERDLYGSQQSYFDRLSEVTNLTRDRISAETNVVSIAENRDSPFDSTGKVKDSVDSQTSVLGAKLDAVNTNLGALIQQLGSGGSTSDRGYYNVAFGGTY